MRTIGWLLVGVTGAAALAGCGHCGGAMRSMDGGEVGPDASFSIVADGPGDMESDELLADAGVDSGTWFLLDAAGEPVPATLFADSGGHVCMNGNSFSLVPDAPLEPGDYTLVLRVDALEWEYVGDKDALTTFEGEAALVSDVTVTGT